MTSISMQTCHHKAINLTIKTNTAKTISLITRMIKINHIMINIISSSKANTSQWTTINMDFSLLMISMDDNNSQINRRKCMDITQTNLNMKQIKGSISTNNMHRINRTSILNNNQCKITSTTMTISTTIAWTTTTAISSNISNNTTCSKCGQMEIKTSSNSLNTTTNSNMTPSKTSTKWTKTNMTINGNNKPWTVVSLWTSNTQMKGFCRLTLLPNIQEICQRRPANKRRTFKPSHIKVLPSKWPNKKIKHRRTNPSDKLTLYKMATNRKIRLELMMEERR